MDVLEAIARRVSVRKFVDEPVGRDLIETLLKAAMQAPSAARQRAWEFIVVENRETLRRLAAADEFAETAGDAPLAIVVLCNNALLEQPLYWQQELAAATQNLLLAAVELGLGAVWMGIAPKEQRMRYLKDLFGLPDAVKPFAVITIGRPDPAQIPSSENRFDGGKIHYESYGEHRGKGSSSEI